MLNPSHTGSTCPALEAWAAILGATECLEHVPRAMLHDPHLTFTVLDPEARERVLLRVLKTLQSPLEKAGAHRKSRWMQGWQENLEEFIASHYDLNKLAPKFVRRREVMRLGNQYIQPATDFLEAAMVGVLRRFLFKRFFSEINPVYEFGTGTGHNLVAFAQQFPEKSLHGLDWVQPSVQILELLRQEHHLNIHGHLFDLGAPDSTLRLEPHSGIFTVGALEQLGSQFQPFLDYLLSNQPALCVHVETLYELYDQESLFDWVAAQYLEKRSYLHGFLTTLRNLESRGCIRILKVQRTFGSLYHDGYSYVAWQPLGKS